MARGLGAGRGLVVRMSSDVEQAAGDPRFSPRASARAPRKRKLWGLTAGASAAFLSGACLAVVTTPALGAVWAIVLVFLAPSSARLDRRVALNLALVFGLTPVALWVPSALGGRSAAIVALALGTAASVAAAVIRPGRLVPSVRRRDAVILVAGMLAWLVALPLRSPGSPQRALALLSTGIDNSYHYAMFLEQRLAAAGSPLVAANADGSGFAFDDYPQWFHKLLTVLAQIGFGGPESATTELVRFAQLQWLVFGALAVLITAALLQALPQRVPLALLVPSFVILFSLLLGVPGALNLIQGHLSFLIAACAPLVMFLLALPHPRPGPGLFVVLGGLVLVAASWMLLLPMAGAALLPPVIAVWRRQRATVRWLTLAGVGIVVAAAFGLFVLGPLTNSGFAAVLRDGTVPRVTLPVMLTLLAGSVALVAALSARRRDVHLGGHLLLALAAVAETLGLGTYMLSTTGELTYYFWKLGLGSLLVTIVVAAHAVLMVNTARDTGRSGRLGSVASVAVALVAAAGLGSALQEFAAPSALWAGSLPSLLEARTTSGSAGDVDVVIRLAESLDPGHAAHTRLLATRPEDMNAAHASEWFHALSHSSTRRIVSLDDGVYELALDRGDLALGVELAKGTLADVDGHVLVTDPSLYAAIVDAVPLPEESRISLVS